MDKSKEPALRHWIVGSFAMAGLIASANATVHLISRRFGISETGATIGVSAFINLAFAVFLSIVLKDRFSVREFFLCLLKGYLQIGSLLLATILMIGGLSKISKFLGLGSWSWLMVATGFAVCFLFARAAAPNRPLWNLLLARLPDRKPVPVRHAFRRGDDFVVNLRRGHEFREPIAEIAGYRFAKVWFLEIVRKDGSVNRIELPTLSRKPEIESVMRAGGIPMVPGGT